MNNTHVINKEKIAWSNVNSSTNLRSDEISTLPIFLTITDNSQVREPFVKRPSISMTCHPSITVTGSSVDSDRGKGSVLTDQELVIKLICKPFLVAISTWKQLTEYFIKSTSERVTLLKLLSVMVGVCCSATIWDARISTIEPSDA